MEKASFSVFLTTIALAIVGFLPPTLVPFMVLKTVVIALGILISLVLYCISRLKAGSISFPFHPVIVIGALAGLTAIVSSILSLSPTNSFFGPNFDQYSGLFIILVLLAALLSVVLGNTRERIASIIVTVIGSYTLVALFHILRFSFGAGFLQLGTFSAMTSTMVGSWYDFAILSGLIFLISFFILESYTVGSLPLSGRMKIISGIFLVVSFLFVVTVGLPLVWMVLCATIFLFTLYRIYRMYTSRSAERSTKSALPYFAIVALIVTALFAWQGQRFSTPIVQRFNLHYGEVTLPWRSTLDVAVSTVKSYPLFGAGPDRFSGQYLLYKPQTINSTQFWNVTFPSGSSFILTSFVDEGIVGFLIWAVLFVWFAVTGIRVLRKPPEAKISQFILGTTFMSAFFLWCMIILYTPSHAVIFITFIMTGLFLAAMECEYAHGGSTTSMIKSFEVTGLKRSHGGSETAKIARAAIVILWIVIVFSVGVVLICIRDAAAQTYFQSGINASIVGNVSAARASFNNALGLRKSDEYYGALAQLDTFDVNSIISTASAASTSAVGAIGALINEGIGYAHSAQSIDPVNSNNYLAEADIAEIAAAINVPNSYEASKAAYIRALNLSPRNPSIYLSLARLEYVAGSSTLAKSDIMTAVQLKPDFSDAFFEAGLISYNEKNYQSAAAAFSKVLSIDPSYANAAYFLGLTFARGNDTADAITVFTTLAKAYPDNATVAAILADLQAGKSIFSDAAAQTNTPPSLTPTKVIVPAKTTSKNVKSTKTSSTTSSSASTSER